MILQTRIDYRLLHGQVIYVWTNYLSVDAILVANDKVANDIFQKRMMSLAKPVGVKIIFKTIEESIEAINSGKTDNYNLYIIVENVEDAYKLYKGTKLIDKINLGLSSKKENSKNIAKSIYIDKEEEKLLVEMAKNGVFVNVKQAPGDEDKDILNLV
ncbi:MAG: PTS sugar transporter subunit IIB [Erysipelotrichaceae bacterium]|nr:PTS sugar transporter subunit IIB [Erysipelotrichaceae bacterium]